MAEINFTVIEIDKIIKCLYKKIELEQKVFINEDLWKANMRSYLTHELNRLKNHEIDDQYEFCENAYKFFILSEKPKVYGISDDSYCNMQLGNREFVIKAIENEIPEVTNALSLLDD